MERIRVASWIVVILGLLIHTHAAPADGQLGVHVDLKPNVLPGDGKAEINTFAIGKAQNITNNLTNNILNQTINIINENEKNISEILHGVEIQNHQPNAMETILINAVKSSKSLVDQFGGDTDYLINVNDPKLNENSSMHIIKHHPKKFIDNEKSQETKTVAEKLLDNTFDSLLSTSSLSQFISGGNPKVKRVFPERNTNNTTVGQNTDTNDNSSIIKLDKENWDYKLIGQSSSFDHNITNDRNTLPFNEFNKSFPLRPLNRPNNSYASQSSSLLKKNDVAKISTTDLHAETHQPIGFQIKPSNSQTKLSDSPIPSNFGKIFQTTDYSTEIQQSNEEVESEEDEQNYRRHFTNGPHGVDFSSNSRLNKPNASTNKIVINKNESKEGGSLKENSQILQEQEKDSEISNVDLKKDTKYIKKTFRTQDEKNYSEQAFSRGILSLNTFRQFFENNDIAFAKTNQSKSDKTEDSQKNVLEINTNIFSNDDKSNNDTKSSKNTIKTLSNSNQSTNNAEVRQSNTGGSNYILDILNLSLSGQEEVTNNKVNATHTNQASYEKQNTNQLNENNNPSQIRGILKFNDKKSEENVFGENHSVTSGDEHSITSHIQESTSAGKTTVTNVARKIIDSNNDSDEDPNFENYPPNFINKNSVANQTETILANIKNIIANSIQLKSKSNNKTNNPDNITTREKILNVSDFITGNNISVKQTDSINNGDLNLNEELNKTSTSQETSKKSSTKLSNVNTSGVDISTECSKLFENNTNTLSGSVPTTIHSTIVTLEKSEQSSNSDTNLNMTNKNIANEIQRGNTRYNSQGDVLTISKDAESTILEKVTTSSATNDRNEKPSITGIIGQSVLSTFNLPNKTKDNDQKIIIEGNKKSDIKTKGTNVELLGKDKGKDTSHIIKLTVLSQKDQINSITNSTFESNITSNSDSSSINRSNKNLLAEDHSINRISGIPENNLQKNKESSIITVHKNPIKGIPSLVANKSQIQESRIKITNTQHTGNINLNTKTSNTGNNILLETSSANPTTSGKESNTRISQESNGINIEKSFLSDKKSTEITNDDIGSLTGKQQISSIVIFNTNTSSDNSDPFIDATIGKNKSDLDTAAFERHVNSFPTNLAKVLESMKYIDSLANKTFLNNDNIQVTIDNTSNFSPEKNKKVTDDINLQKIYELEKETLKRTDKLENDTVNLKTVIDKLSESVSSEKSNDEVKQQNNIQKNLNTGITTSSSSGSDTIKDTVFTQLQDTIISQDKYTIRKDLSGRPNTTIINKAATGNSGFIIDTNSNNKKNYIGVLRTNENNILHKTDLKSAQDGSNENVLNQVQISSTDTKSQNKLFITNTLLSNDTNLNESSQISDYSDSHQRKIIEGEFKNIDLLSKTKQIGSTENVSLIKKNKPDTTGINTQLIKAENDGSNITNQTISNSKNIESSSSGLQTSSSSSALFGLNLLKNSNISANGKTSLTAQQSDNKDSVSVGINDGKLSRTSTSNSENYNQRGNLGTLTGNRGSSKFHVSNINDSLSVTSNSNTTDLVNSHSRGHLRTTTNVKENEFITNNKPNILNTHSVTQITTYVDQQAFKHPNSNENKAKASGVDLSNSNENDQKQIKNNILSYDLNKNNTIKSDLENGGSSATIDQSNSQKTYISGGVTSNRSNLQRVSNDVSSQENVNANNVRYNSQRNGNESRNFVGSLASSLSNDHNRVVTEKPAILSSITTTNDLNNNERLSISTSNRRKVSTASTQFNANENETRLNNINGNNQHTSKLNPSTSSVQFGSTDDKEILSVKSSEDIIRTNSNNQNTNDFSRTDYRRRQNVVINNVKTLNEQGNVDTQAKLGNENYPAGYVRTHNSGSNSNINLTPGVGSNEQDINASRGEKKFTPSRFETISPFSTDSLYNSLYPGNPEPTSSSFSNSSGRYSPRNNVVKFKTEASSTNFGGQHIGINGNTNAEETVINKNPSSVVRGNGTISPFSTDSQHKNLYSGNPESTSSSSSDVSGRYKPRNDVVKFKTEASSNNFGGQNIGINGNTNSEETVINKNPSSVVRGNETISPLSTDSQHKNLYSGNPDSTSSSYSDLSGRYKPRNDVVKFKTEASSTNFGGQNIGINGNTNAEETVINKNPSSVVHGNETISPLSTDSLHKNLYSGNPESSSSSSSDLSGRYKPRNDVIKFKTEASSTNFGGQNIGINGNTNAEETVIKKNPSSVFRGNGTRSLFSTDYEYKNLYPGNSESTSSLSNDLSGRYRPRNNGVKFKTEASSANFGGQNIGINGNTNAKETVIKKNPSSVFRGNIKFVWDPLSPDQFYDDTDAFPSQFLYTYKTPTGISAYQKGTLKEINTQKVFIVQGSYEYTSPDGTPILVNYTADENGFHPQISSAKKLDAASEDVLVEPNVEKDIHSQNDAYLSN